MNLFETSKKFGTEIQIEEAVGVSKQRAREFELYYMYIFLNICVS